MTHYGLSSRKRPPWRDVSLGQGRLREVQLYFNFVYSFAYQPQLQARSSRIPRIIWSIVLFFFSSQYYYYREDDTPVPIPQRYETHADLKPPLSANHVFNS